MAAAGRAAATAATAEVDISMRSHEGLRLRRCCRQGRRMANSSSQGTCSHSSSCRPAPLCTCRSLVAVLMTWAAVAVVAAETAAMGLTAEGQAGELYSPDLQTTGWRWPTRCTARSGHGRLNCIQCSHLGSRWARCGRSTRTRRSPHRAARTLAPCRDSFQKRSTSSCCRWRLDRSLLPEQPTAR